MKKILITITVVLVSCVTLWFLWASIEKFTGAKAWDKTQAYLKAEKIRLDLSDHLPQPVPDTSNFCMTPLIAALSTFEAGNSNKYQQPELRERFLKLQLPKEISSHKDWAPNWQVGKRADLTQLKEVLGSELSTKQWLARYQSDLSSLDQAALRPHAQLPMEFSDSFVENIEMALPQLNDLRKFANFQAVRAVIAMENADHDEASKATRSLFQTFQATNSHPTLIGYLISISVLDLYISTIWHGAYIDFWDTSEWQEIQQEVSKMKPLKSLETALMVEMISFQIGGSDYVKSLGFSDMRLFKDLLAGVGQSGGTGAALVLVPDGVWDHNKAFACKLLFEQGIMPVRDRRLPNKDAFNEAMDNAGMRYFLAKVSLPAVYNIITRGYHAENAASMIQLAGSVERYHLDEGQFPDSLDRLVPKYINSIPSDIMKPGSRLTYRKVDSPGHYMIYSVGENQVDDGGKVETKAGNPSRVDRSKGDWVWKR